MIQKDFSKIDAQDIRELVDNCIRESRTLEYKEELPGRKDEDKKEFLADVSSFANASGGDIIYGISESRDANNARGEPQAALGLLVANADVEARRLESLIRDGISPRIQGFQVRVIEGFPNGPVIIIRVPRSWSGPHMVTHQNHSRFYSRTSAGKYQLDISEIRSAFIAAEELPARIRRFRDDRVGRIVADETPVLMTGQSKIVLHLLPTVSFGARQHVDAFQIMGDHMATLFRPINTRSWDHRINLDGFLCWQRIKEQCPAYTQVFRSGVVEAVNSHILSLDEGKLHATVIEKQVMSSARDYLAAYRHLQVAPPVVVLLSLLMVKGYSLAGSHWDSEYIGPPPVIDRDVVILPDIVIEDFDTPIEEALKPIFDRIWQAGGFRGSPNYHDDGQWRPR